MSKMTWKKESGFIWSLLGSAIGFGNILSFSAQCYKNGGGAFLIPFVVALAAFGVPMLFLEGIIGNKMQLPIVAAYGKILGRLGKTFGWLMIGAVATIGGFYTVLTGYSIAYTYFAATLQIPENTADFFKHAFLQDSGSLSNIGSISWPIVIVTLVCALFSWVVLIRNIRSGIEKICSLFMPILMVFILFFALFVAFLPGSSIGFSHYLIPDFAKLSDPKLWRDVFGQVFFSFSLGIGIITAYSRYTDSNTSIPRAMWYMALGNLLVSLVAGFAIFGAVGHFSFVSGISFEQIVPTDSTFEMGFVIFPKILNLFPPIISSIFGAFFFFALFIAGITGVFSIAESFSGNIEEEYGYSRKKSVTIASSIMALISLFFCMGNGQHLLGTLAPMLLGNNMLFGGLAEIFVFMWLAKEIKDHKIWFKNGSRSLVYHLASKVAPIIVSIILFASLSSEFYDEPMLNIAVRYGWFLLALSIASLLSLKKDLRYGVALKN
jgi:NSS family neurotransmitter:Na+ symporter